MFSILESDFRYLPTQFPNNLSLGLSEILYYQLKFCLEMPLLIELDSNKTVILWLPELCGRVDLDGPMLLQC